MTKRIQKLIAAVAALSALALGGAVFAQAQTPSASPERVTAPDRDSVQSGDQTTPDKAPVTAHSRSHAVGAATDPAGGGTDQSGSQTAPDTGSPSETAAPEAASSETAAGSESGSASDGPGGHADPAQNGNADHQFQGTE